MKKRSRMKMGKHKRILLGTGAALLVVALAMLSGMYASYLKGTPFVPPPLTVTPPPIAAPSTIVPTPVVSPSSGGGASCLVTDSSGTTTCVSVFGASSCISSPGFNRVYVAGGSCSQLYPTAACRVTPNDGSPQYCTYKKSYQCTSTSTETKQWLGEFSVCPPPSSTLPIPPLPSTDVYGACKMTFSTGTTCNEMNQSQCVTSGGVIRQWMGPGLCSAYFPLGSCRIMSGGTLLNCFAGQTQLNCVPPITPPGATATFTVGGTCS